MNSTLTSLIKHAVLCLMLLLSACTVAERENRAATSLPPAPTSTHPIQASSTSLPIGVEPSVETIQTVSVTPTQTASLIQPTTGTPTTTSESTPTLVPTMKATPAFLQGPLIAFRVQNGEGYLLLLDIGTLTLREIRQDFLAYPFPLEWLDNGCHLYAHGRVMDLQGNVIEYIPDFEDINLFLSPDRSWGVNEVYLGIFEGDSFEYRSLVVTNRVNSEWQIPLAPNGGAYAYAWSPTGEWLAYSDYDENQILQVYRATPDGQTVQQLTFHSEEPGVINLIVWSPDEQHLAYAASTLLPHQFDRGDEGWIGLISLTDLQTTQVIPDNQFAYVEGIWWSLDSNRIAFVGENLPTVLQDNPVYGTRIHWAEINTGTIFNSFYSAQAPFGHFGFPVPVGDINTIFFSAEDGYYLLNATANDYEKILDTIETDGLIRDFATTPFDFPSEASCME